MGYLARQQQTPFATALLEYQRQAVARYHTPGHKAGCGFPVDLIPHLRDALLLDVSDEVHSPPDQHDFVPVLQRAQQLAAEVWGAKKTLFVSNGTSGALYTSLLATTDEGSTVVLPRNVHLSIINGLVLTGADHYFLPPAYHPDLGICLPPSSEEIQNALAACRTAGRRVSACILVRPDYYGLAGDIRKWRQVTDQIPLIIDEAHGAHFHFHERFPVDAVSAGADLVAQSTHKTLSALTQASMLHWQGETVSWNRLQKMLPLTSSTSPSFLLYASLDVARRQVALQGRSLMERVLELANWARKAINSIPGLFCYGPELIDNRRITAVDGTRLLIAVDKLGLSGIEAERILREDCGIQVEMSDWRHVLALITLGDDWDSMHRLVAALRMLAEGGRQAQSNDSTAGRRLCAPALPPRRMSPREACLASAKRVPLTAAKGYIAADVIVAYPPGTVIICPGEEITPEILEYLKWIECLGAYVRGVNQGQIQVVV